MEQVIVEHFGTTVVVRFNEPTKANAFSDEMRAAAIDALERAMNDAAIRAIVLTGAGGRFSAGSDIRQMIAADKPDPQRARRRLATLQQVVRLIAGGPKPVIAAVEGVAFGAGFAIAAACDYVIAGDDARFGAAFGNIALTADCGILWSLPARIGLPKTRDLLFTGAVLDATEAARLGVVDRVVTAGRAEAEALVKADTFIATAPLSIAAVKTAIFEGCFDLDATLKRELHQQTMLLSTEDHAEGRRAFLEKRKPEFVGR